MSFKSLKEAIFEKVNRKRKRVKGAAKSYVSLFVIISLVVVGTTAWFSAKDQINITVPQHSFNSYTGIHDDQFQTLQTEIMIPDFKLEEASSIDGRNIYFPSTMWNNPSDTNSASVVYRNTSSTSLDTDLINWGNDSTSGTTLYNMSQQTNGMRFREANAGDKNIHYAWGDADIDSVGGETKVWIKGYKIVIGNEADIISHNEADCYVYQDKLDISDDYTSQHFPNPYSCPVRIAIIDDSGHTPKVFDPSAKLHDYVDKTYAVYSITNDGTPTLQYTANLESFGSYYYGTDNPLFKIPAGGHINMTVVAWLEGTHPNANAFIGKHMTISLEVETNVSQMENIYLHDWTIGDTYEDINGSVTESNYFDAGDFVHYNGSGEIDCQGKWLSGDVNIAMSYFDEFADTYKTTVMTEVTSTNVTAQDVEYGINGTTGKDSRGRTVYRAAIPSYVQTKISFYRLSKWNDDVYPGTVFNAWHTYGEKNGSGTITSSVNGALSTKAKGWRVLGNLTIDRNKDASSCYNHYYALRGNGNGNVLHKNPSRYSLWLAPGVGYWGTSNGPVKVSGALIDV